MRRHLFALWLLAIALPLQAQTARQQLDGFARGLKTASASFQQVVTGPNGENVQSAQGLLQMKSPNLFRWEYSKPNPQLIVADGQEWDCAHASTARATKDAAHHRSTGGSCSKRGP